MSEVVIDRLSRDDAGTDWEHRGPLDAAPGRQLTEPAVMARSLGELPRDLHEMPTRLARAQRHSGQAPDERALAASHRRCGLEGQPTAELM